jgi:hypothetical protein
MLDALHGEPEFIIVYIRLGMENGVGERLFQKVKIEIRGIVHFGMAP